MTSLASPLGDQAADLTNLHGSLSTPLGSDPDDGAPRRDRSSLFDLRGDIIQYANPLRAKILLYSCLYGPFGYTAQDWSSLNRRTLDDLLQETFEYCPTYSDLDSKLTIIAHCLGRMGDGGQVSSTVTQAMRAYYPQDPHGALAPLEATAQSTHPEVAPGLSRSSDRPAAVAHAAARPSA